MIHLFALEEEVDACLLTIVFVFLEDILDYYATEHLVKELVIVVPMDFVLTQTIVLALLDGGIQIAAHSTVTLSIIVLILKALAQVLLNAIVQINGQDLTVILLFASQSVLYHLWFVQEMEIVHLLTNVNANKVGQEIIVNLPFAITSMQQILLFVM
jgi:hypothetical protein